MLKSSETPSVPKSASATRPAVKGQHIGRHFAAGIQGDRGGAYQHDPRRVTITTTRTARDALRMLEENLVMARQQRAGGAAGPPPGCARKMSGGHADDPAAQDAQRRARGVHRVGQPGQPEHHQRDPRHVVEDSLGGGEAERSLRWNRSDMERRDGGGGATPGPHVDAEREHEIAEPRAGEDDVVDGDHGGGDEAHDGHGPEGEVFPALLHRLALHVEEPVGQDTWAPARRRRGSPGVVAAPMPIAHSSG